MLSLTRSPKKSESALPRFAVVCRSCVTRLSWPGLRDDLEDDFSSFAGVGIAGSSTLTAGTLSVLRIKNRLSYSATTQEQKSA